MIRKSLLVSIILLLALSLLTACGDNRTASQILEDALKKNATVKSQSFNGFIELGLTFSDSLIQNAPPEGQLFLQSLKNFRLTYEGAMNTEPLEGEITLSTEIPFGDLKTKIDLPILIKEEKVWIKVPQLPIPDLQNYAGKFIELDLKELEKLSGVDTLPTDPANIAENAKVMNKMYYEEIFPLFFKSYGETYFKKGDLNEVEVPKEIAAKQSVEFTLTQEQLEPFITSMLSDFIPKVLDIMAKPEYRDVTKVTADQLNEAKKSIEEAKSQWEKNKGNLNQYIQNLSIKGVSVIDKEGYLAHTVFDMGADLSDPENPGTVSIKLKAQSSSLNINQKPSFKNTIPPSSGEIIPFQELINGLGGL
ncbi:exported hypothetical protein [[Clostridium] ultunense Esp]|uniref:hypothetical protein n=1 Tax=Thermicanus aegyptius TaxID=94009 RepID=UPI0002B70C42|nr:hypothetical protein [Thermicanus aegyptius]CCQ92392.1 exported hypothetical protein [[Clostridium] ultunense Esp]